MNRRIATVAIRPLGERPDAGLSTSGTVESRLALVETLTREAWSLAGHMLPPCARANNAVHVRPLRPAANAPSREQPAGR